MRIYEYTNDGLHEELLPELRKQFAEHMEELKQFNAPTLPKSGTQADLGILYEEQAKMSANLFRAHHIVSAWHKLYIEISALVDRRTAEDLRDRHKWVAKKIKDGDEAELKPFRSEESKLRYAGDDLDLPGVINITYVASLCRGWYSQVSAHYTRLEKQNDILLTHLGILRSMLG